MTAKEFKETVDAAVAAGADRKATEDYVRAGYKVEDETAESKPKTSRKRK